MRRRRHDREVRELADQLAAELAADVHEQLKGRATDAVRGRPQDPKLSGLEGTMLLNGAYLVEAGKAGRLRELAAELQERHRELGARLEVSGPLPPYNFAGRGAAA
jgi:Gas vesicle synthesis protein GvpL/GvpF